MRRRTFLLFILLLSQPLAAFNLNCGMPVNDAIVGSAVSDAHCADHASDARESVNGHEQVPDQHPAGHAAAGGHCQFCAAGAFLPPAASLLTVSLPVGSSTLPSAAPAPQFQSGPLFRPPIH
jgi:hypothetical protein